MLCIRDRIAAAAVAELGNGDPSRYWLDVLDPPQADPRDAKGNRLSWCGAFCLACLHKVGAAEGVKWIPGRGFELRLKTTRGPRVGDIAYRDKPFQHRAIVIGVGATTIDTVDGNSDGGRVVQHCGVPRSKWTAFFDVEPLLPKAEVTS